MVSYNDVQGLELALVKEKYQRKFLDDNSSSSSSVKYYYRDELQEFLKFYPIWSEISHKINELKECNDKTRKAVLKAEIKGIKESHNDYVKYYKGKKHWFTFLRPYGVPKEGSVRNQPIARIKPGKEIRHLYHLKPMKPLKKDHIQIIVPFEDTFDHMITILKIVESTEDESFKDKVLKSPNHFGLTGRMVSFFKKTLVSFIEKGNESSSEDEITNEGEDFDGFYDETEDDSDPSSPHHNHNQKVVEMSSEEKQFTGDQVVLPASRKDNHNEESVVGEKLSEDTTKENQLSVNKIPLRDTVNHSGNNNKK